MSQKYSALSGCDFGLLHNGEITVEAAGCQLPATVISSMSNARAYLTYLFNGHESPLNVSTNYEGYEDLCGSFTAIGEKVKTLMVQYFERPKLRYHLVKLYRDHIQKMLYQDGNNPELNVTKTGLETASGEIIAKVQAFEEKDKSIELYWGKRR